VILVDADIDPFNLPQVMWAISTKAQPSHDVVVIPGLGVVPLDPGSNPPGLTHKVIIDATTPITPDVRGHYHQPVEAPMNTQEWEKRLGPMLKSLAQGDGK
jgi:3-polyprenyl-4-hydroxybenzoate decarboxylase